MKTSVWVKLGTVSSLCIFSFSVLTYYRKNEKEKARNEIISEYEDFGEPKLMSNENYIYDKYDSIMINYTPIEIMLDTIQEEITYGDLNYIQMKLFDRLSTDQGLREFLYCLDESSLSYWEGEEIKEKLFSIESSHSKALYIISLSDVNSEINIVCQIIYEFIKLKIL